MRAITHHDKGQFILARTIFYTEMFNPRVSGVTSVISRPTISSVMVKNPPPSAPTSLSTVMRNLSGILFYLVAIILLTFIDLLSLNEVTPILLTDVKSGVSDPINQRVRTQSIIFPMGALPSDLHGVKWNT
jgi:hypothetical protein